MTHEIMPGIVMRETSPDFREGFNFAVRAIHDVFKNQEGYTLVKLDELLSSIVTLIDNDSWWPDIKKIIIRGSE